MGGPSLHNGHAGKLTVDKTRYQTLFLQVCRTSSTPSLPLLCRVPGQFVGWLCAGPKMTSSAVAELDQLLRRKKYTCCIPLFGREMGYIGETETAELAVVCSWVLLAPQLVSGAKCSRDCRRPRTVEQVPPHREVLCLPGTCW